jgi:hypothetical protein
VRPTDSQETVVAQRVQVLLVCDLHDEEVEGSETVAFGLDGASYEVDACEEHAAALRDAFAPYVGAARRAGRAPAAAPRRARPAASGASSSGSRQDVQDIREWARANGHAISERGRLPGAVVAAYQQAHQQA